MKSSISSFHHHSGRHLSSLTSIASRALTATQSAFKALSDPTRGQDVARLGDITSSPFLPRIRDLMLLDPTGRRILREQPMISSDSIHLHSRLSRMKQGSFGKSYADFMRVNGITPDSRQRVIQEYVPDQELQYVLNRYRQVHDFFHTITGLGISPGDEVALKWFEFVQLGLPVAGLSALVGPLAVKDKRGERDHVLSVLAPWAVQCGQSCTFLMNVYYEEMFEMDLQEFRKRLGVIPPPVATHHLL